MLYILLIRVKTRFMILIGTLYTRFDRLRGVFFPRARGPGGGARGGE